MRKLFGTVLPYVGIDLRRRVLKLAWLGFGLSMGSEPKKAGAQPPWVGEPMRCGSREDNPQADRAFPGPDRWRLMLDGTRTCSCCGSLHEDDFLDILARYAAGEPGYHFDRSTKGYKAYAHRPGVANASQGGIKFYGWHADPDPSPEAKARREDLFRRARERNQLEIDALMAKRRASA